MNAIEKINQNLNVKKILEHYEFNNIRYNGDIIRACCKIHDGNNQDAFVINEETGLWFCHTNSCGGGDIFTLVQSLEKCSFYNAVNTLANLLSIDIDGLEVKEINNKKQNELKEFIRLIQEKRKQPYKEFIIKEQIKQVTKFRNFKKETLEHFRLGFVDEIELTGKENNLYKLKNRLVFPVIQEGMVVGVSLRKTKASDILKWSHQPKRIETKKILYNYDEAKQSNTIVVCEGIVDVWAYYEIGVTAVCTFGAHLSKEQYKLLLKTGADIVLSYDGDTAGRLASEKAIKMLKNTTNLYTVNLAQNSDPANISREELEREYKNRRREC